MGMQVLQCNISGVFLTAGDGPRQIWFAEGAGRAKAMARFRFWADVWDMAGIVAAVVVAGGRGLRAGGDRPKQYRKLAGQPAIRPSLALLADHRQISVVQPVIHPDDMALYEAASAGLDLLPPVLGGSTRQASVRAGLEALEVRQPEVVLVHDAARPFA